MATSTDVARHAGLSRSTVSQVLNGRGHLFAEETIARVHASAESLGYRPSLAGRTLARGTSDIVITVLPDATFNPRIRELVDIITKGMADAGLTNLLQFIDRGHRLEHAVLGLKPFGIVSLVPLPAEQYERLRAQAVRSVVQPDHVQVAIDEAIGRLQAEHLAAAGYTTMATVLPVSARESTFAAPRDAGARDSASRHGLRVLPTMHVALEPRGAVDAIAGLPAEPIGLAAYNDEVAMALVGAAIKRGRTFPEDIGVIGIDNSPIARASTPTITTVDFDISFSGEGILQLLLQEPDGPQPSDPAGLVTDRLTVIQGETTRTPPVL